MNKTLRVLHVEDQERDALLIARHLTNAGYQLKSERVDTAEAMRTALETEAWDIILCDYSMPHFDALRALRVRKDMEVDTPLIIISGTIGEAVAVESMLAGANDYLMKDNLIRLVPAIERELHDAINRRKAREADEKLIEMKNDLQSAVNGYERVLDNSLDVICSIDEEGRFAAVSNASREIWGYEPEELIGKLYMDLVHPDDQAITAQAATEIMAGISVRNFENRYFHRDGRIIPVMWSARWLDSEKTIFAVARDITESKQAALALTESEERLRLVLDGLGAEVFVGLMDTDGVLLLVNRPALEAAALRAEDVLGQPCQDTYWWVYSDDVRRRLSEAIERAARGEASRYDEQIRVAEGELVWIDFTVQPLRDEAGKIVFIVPSAVVITERKLAEATLRKSEERLRLLFEQMRDGFYYSTPDGHLLDINPAMVEMFGYSSREEMLKVDILRDLYFSPEERKSRKLDEGKDESEVYRMRRKDGSAIWVEDRGQYKYDEDGTVAFHQGILRDVTERKLAEERLIQSEERYRDLIENAYDMIFVRDMDGNITSINAAGEKLTGYTREELLQMNMQQIVVPEDWGQVQEIIAGLLAGLEETSSEMDICRKDGDRRTLEVNRTLMYRAGVPVGVQGIARDITERKRIEEAMRESEERYRLLFAHNPFPMWVYDLETFKFLAVNDAATFFYGYSSDEFLRMSIKDIRPETDISALVADVSKADGVIEGPAHWQHRRKDGTLIDVEITSHELTFGGRDSRLVLANDITVRKRAEEKLVRSEERYRDLVENAHDIIYSHDLAGNYTSINAACEQIIGYTREEALKLNLVDTVPPGQLEKAKEMIGRKLKGEETTAYELDILAKDGRIVTVEVNSKLVSEGGVPVGIQGIARDVTERKAAREELEQSSALLRIAGQAAHLGGWKLELPERTLTWSDENCIIHDVQPGYIPTLDEGIASYYPEHRAHVLNCVDSCAENGTPYDFELPIVTAKGRHIWIRSIGEAVRDTDGKIVRLQGAIQDITDRKKGEEALRQKDSLIRIAGEVTRTGGWAIEVLTQQLFWTDEVFDILEFPRGEIPELGVALELCPQPGRDTVVAGLEACSKDGIPLDIEVEIDTASGRRIWVRICAEADRKANGTIERIHGAFQDISDRKQTEEQLRQSQKLESIGRLAGGIAHDFNNMLTAINGYSDLTLRKMKADDPLRRNIEEVKKAGERSAALTNQLLAFSRQQILQPEVVYINRIITETSSLLERMIGEDVELITRLHPKTGQVKVDPVQLTQIIMNLAVNARDAMPRGGKLTFETSNVFLDQEYTNQHRYVLPGAYVKLTVSDNGSGMDAETRQHIFEPFFTTKAKGEGTGLGLAMVYGVVKQSGGHIMVYSEPGIGTTFTIYLPRVMEASEEVEAAEVSDELPKGTETILLVEDEEAVRSLTRQILEMCGYTVLEAANGKDALVVCENNPGRIDLLMTDVVMPEMGGRELAEKVSLRWPEMPVLFASGYTDDAIVRHGVIAEKANFIQKPFNMEDLAHKIRSVLDESMAR